MVMRQSFSVDPEIMERIDKYSKSKGLKRDEAILELVEAGIGYTENGGEIKIENKRSFDEYYKIRRDLENLNRNMQEMKTQMQELRAMIELHDRQICETLTNGKWEKGKKKAFYDRLSL